MIQIVMLLLVIINPQLQQIFKDQLACITLVLVAAYMSAVAYLYIYFSGTPYRNETFKTMMRRLAIIFFLWSICQMPKAIFSLAKINAFPSDGGPEP